MERKVGLSKYFTERSPLLLIGKFIVETAVIFGLLISHTLGVIGGGGGK